MIGAALALGMAGSPTVAVADSARTQAKLLFRRMTLEQKVGQLFVVEVYGRDAYTVSDAFAAKNQALYGVRTPAEVLRKYRPGGVIYYNAGRGPDNLGDSRQIARLSNQLQSVAVGAEQGAPLFLSIDQEGGLVFRLPTPPATELPGNMALAATRSAEASYRSAEIIGTELAALGINQNYGPVADVNINPDNPVIGIRSFGSDPALVSELVAAAVIGQRRGGIFSCGKHFPGHGDTNTDSHFGLPRINHTREQLDTIDLPPFRAAIAAGVDTLMTAHIVVPALDASEVPATMSEKILTGLLREELGFQGLIVTDALDMQGASGTYPPDVAPVAAFQAGADMLVLAPKLDVAFAAVLGAVRDGRISEARLAESVLRILERKYAKGMFADWDVSENRAVRVVGNAAHKADAKAIAERAITLVRNEGQLPLAAAARKVLVTGWGVATTTLLSQSVAARAGQSVTTLETGAVPTQAKIDAAVAAAAQSDLVVVSSNALAAGALEKGAAQAAFVAALLATGKQVVVIGVRNAYDIRRFTAAPAFVCTYGYGATLLESAVKVIFGELSPTGELPVAIPAFEDPATELYPFGHGLHY